MKEENRSHKDGEEPQGKRAHQDGEPKSKASSKTRTPVARTQPVSPDEGDHDEAGSGSSSRIDGLSAEFLGKIVASWQHAFSQSVRAIAYLKGRGLFVRDLLLALSIGYSSGKLPQILPRDDKLRRQLIEMGILNDRGNEFFYRRLVCPLFDQAGMLVNVYGRALDAHAQTPHLYLSGPRRGVFNRVGCLASREVIVTEAPLDAVSVAVMGFLNTTASFGAGGFTADHMALLLEGKIGRVYCAYDADPAGEHGADQLASDLAVHGIECLRVKWPVHIKDANDFLVAGGTRESLRSLLDEARPMTTLVPRPSRAAGSQPQDRVRQPEDSSLRAMPKDASPANEPTAAVFSERPSVSSDLLITAPQPPPAPPSPTSAPSPGLTPSASPSPGPAPHPPAGPLEPPQGEAPPVKPVAAETSVTVGPSASTAPSTATGENLITCGDRVYEVIALPRSGPGALRVRLKIDRDGKTFLDTLNLYSDAARSAAVHKISMLFGAKLRRELIEKDFHAMIAELHRRQAAAAPPPPVDPVEAMSLEDREEAIEFLRANDLIARIRADITGMGVVGEARAKLLMYLAILSRRLPTPLSLITISRSGAGKSFVMTCVLDLTPEGEVFVYTRVTAKALYNVDDALRLRHKVLVIE